MERTAAIVLRCRCRLEGLLLRYNRAPVSVRTKHDSGRSRDSATRIRICDKEPLPAFDCRRNWNRLEVKWWRQ
jgi:hypothetical protein